MTAFAAGPEDFWDVVELVPAAFSVPPVGAGGAAGPALVEVPFTTRPGAWCPGQSALLARLFLDDVPMPEIAQRLGRSLWSVRGRVGALVLRRDSRVAWSLVEDRELVRRYPYESTEAVAGDLGRTVAAVHRRASTLGVKAHSRHVWDEADAERLRALFGEDLAVAAIASALGKTVGAVRKQLASMDLRRESHSPWTEADHQEVRDRYGVDSTADIARDLGRGVRAVYSKAAELGLSAPATAGWTDRELEDLGEMFHAGVPLQDIVARLERSRDAVRTKIHDLGLRRNTPQAWTAEDEDELRRRYGAEPASAIAQDLGRGTPAVYARALALGLGRTIEPDWSDWELAQLDAGYPTEIPVPALARMIGRTLAALTTKAHDRGLRRPGARDRWAVEEEQELHRGVVDGKTAREISVRLRGLGFERSRVAVKVRLKALGYDRASSAPYLPEEDDRIRQGYAAAEATESIAAALARGVSGIRFRAGQLGLRHPKPNGARAGEPWTAAQHARLREGYAGGEQPQSIADATGKSLRAVYAEANRLNLTGLLRRQYTPEDDALILRAGLGKGGPTLADVAKRLKRSVQAVSKRKGKLVSGEVVSGQVDGRKARAEARRDAA